MSLGVESDDGVVLGGDEEILPESVFDFLLSWHFKLSN